MKSAAGLAAEVSLICALLWASGCATSPPTYADWKTGEGIAGIDFAHAPTAAEAKANPLVVGVAKDADPMVLEMWRPEGPRFGVQSPTWIGFYTAPGAERRTRAVIGWFRRDPLAAPTAMVGHHPRRGTIFVNAAKKYSLWTLAGGAATVQLRDPSWLKDAGTLDPEAWMAAAKAAAAAEPLDRAAACALIAAGPLEGEAKEANDALIERVSAVDAFGDALRDSLVPERVEHHHYRAAMVWLQRAPRDVCRYANWFSPDGLSPPTWSPVDIEKLQTELLRAKGRRDKGKPKAMHAAARAIPKERFHAHDPEVIGPASFEPLTAFLDSPEGRPLVEDAVQRVMADRAKWDARKAKLAAKADARAKARQAAQAKQDEADAREAAARAEQARIWREGTAVERLRAYIEAGEFSEERLRRIQGRIADELKAARAEGRHATVMAWLAIGHRIEGQLARPPRPWAPPSTSYKPYVPELKAAATGAPPSGALAEAGWRALKVLTQNPVALGQKLATSGSSSLFALQAYNRNWLFYELGVLAPFSGDLAQVVGERAVWWVDGQGVSPVQIVDLKARETTSKGITRGRKTITVKVAADIQTIERLWARKTELQTQMAGAAGRQVTVYDGALMTGRVREGRHGSGARQALPSLGTDNTYHIGAGRKAQVGRDEAAMSATANELATVDAQIRAASGGTRQVEVDVPVEYPLQWQAWTGTVTGHLEFANGRSAKMTWPFEFRYVRHGAVPGTRLEARDEWVTEVEVVNRAFAESGADTAFFQAACAQVHDRLKAAVLAEGGKAGWSDGDTRRELALRMHLLCNEPDPAGFPDWTQMPRRPAK